MKSINFTEPKLTSKQPMKYTIWELFVEGISKYSGVIIGSILGMSAKVALDSKVRKLSVREVIGKYIIGGAGGWIAFNYCKTHDMVDSAAWIVPIATMVSESVISAVIRNVPPFLKFLVTTKTGMKPEDFKED